MCIMLVAFIEPEMVLIAFFFASATVLAFLGTMLALIKVRVDSLRDGSNPSHPFC